MGNRETKVRRLSPSAATLVHYVGPELLVSTAFHMKRPEPTSVGPGDGCRLKFPKIRGPNTDPNIFGSLLQKLLERAPEFVSAHR